jgi:transcriptional regulator GlxA family with amidase domain
LVIIRSEQMKGEQSAQMDPYVPPAISYLENDLRPGGLASWRTKRALAYIEAHLGTKIESAEVADCVALSKSHFSRAFKQSMGSSPMAYVSARRIERAKLMMTSTRERLSDIALACGFADQSHLNRYFRRIVGITPGVWRRHRAAPNPGGAGGRSLRSTTQTRVSGEPAQAAP